MYAMDYPYEYSIDEVRWQDDLPLTVAEKKQFYQTNAEAVFGLPTASAEHVPGGVKHGTVRDNAEELPLAEQQLFGYLSHRRSCTTPTQPQEGLRDPE